MEPTIRAEHHRAVETCGHEDSEGSPATCLRQTLLAGTGCFRGRGLGPLSVSQMQQRRRIVRRSHGDGGFGYRHGGGQLAPQNVPHLLGAHGDRQLHRSVWGRLKNGTKRICYRAEFDSTGIHI